ncbi:MAG TPA: hypothetical protein VE201_00430 [Nitrospirales bacterium]|nr:hypothetical protein [Nitrospirales bacterium]
MTERPFSAPRPPFLCPFLPSRGVQSTGLPITDTRPDGSVTKPRIRVANALSALTPTPVLTVTPASVVAGGTVTATWSGIAAPTSTDFLALYVPGTSDQAYLAWIYLSCSKSPGAPAAAGSCPFTIPSGLTPRSYELRLYANNTYTRLATSNPFDEPSTGETIGTPCEPDPTAIIDWLLKPVP